MAFSEGFNKRLVTFDGMDIIYDEKGSRFLSMRKIQWVNEGEEPDPTKAKLELRKYTVDKDGKEIPGKGVAFLTEEGPHTLTKELIKNGYGNTKEILKELSTRKDFEDSVLNMYTKEEKGSNDFFDMRSALLGYEDGEFVMAYDEMEEE